MLPAIHWLDHPNTEFVIAASHLELLDRWECQRLQDLAGTVHWALTYPAFFRRAGKTRLASVHLGWFLINVPTFNSRFANF